MKARKICLVLTSVFGNVPEGGVSTLSTECKTIVLVRKIERNLLQTWQQHPPYRLWGDGEDGDGIKMQVVYFISKKCHKTMRIGRGEWGRPKSRSKIDGERRRSGWETKSKIRKSPEPTRWSNTEQTTTDEHESGGKMINEMADIKFETTKDERQWCKILEWVFSDVDTIDWIDSCPDNADEEEHQHDLVHSRMIENEAFYG